MSVDRAIVDWANDQLAQAGLPRDATGIRFGYWFECWSSWTHDYGVNATIERSEGSGFESGSVWADVLKALPEYVRAYEGLHDAHDQSHAPPPDGSLNITVDFD